MSQKTTITDWQPLDSLGNLFLANQQVLAARQPALAAKLVELPRRHLYLREHASSLQIALLSNNAVEVQPNPVPPAIAKTVAAKLCPTGQYAQPILVAGLDQGWLWSSLYQLPTLAPGLPGHRPPIYLLVHDLERLRIAMHLHEWRTMLGDPRVHLFAGSDSIDQLRSHLQCNPRLSWPRLSVTLEPALWNDGETLDVLLASVNRGAAAQLQMFTRQNDANAAALSAIDIAARMRSAGPLRVLGITSRYTTFLQHSMRDWLDAFTRLGHQARLVIEDGDHEVMNNVVYAGEIAAFKPDLIVLIDHYRAQLSAVPDNIPCVMWVQDQLPNICSAKGGAAQTDRDYCLGFGRLHLSRQFGYPANRFMPATVPVNESRFVPTFLTDDERASYTCDVSFVSHASIPADVLVQDELAKSTGESRRLLGDIFDRLRAIYDAGQSLTQPILLRRLIETSLTETRTSVDASSMTRLMDFFQQKVNNALFRHQSIEWIAETGADLHLYGNGWDIHPKFSRFARGPANNQTELSAIFRASRINLQATPHGAVHQRLFEGLAAGGFFLIRSCPGDWIEPIFRQLFDWCRATGIHSSAAIQERATPQVRSWLVEIERLLGIGPFHADYTLYEALELSADGEYIRSAGAIWDCYPQVAFDSRLELRQKLAHFLASPDERSRIASQMRQQVLDRFTYTATTRRLLSFIATDLERQAQFRKAAA